MTQNEEKAWNRIEKMYAGFRVNSKGNYIISYKERQKRTRAVLKKYHLDENHILFEHTRQVYEAW